MSDTAKTERELAIKILQDGFSPMVDRAEQLLLAYKRSVLEEAAQVKPENLKWLLDASNQVIEELGKQEHLDSATFRWLCNAVGQVERDLERLIPEIEWTAMQIEELRRKLVDRYRDIEMGNACQLADIAIYELITVPMMTKVKRLVKRTNPCGTK